MLHEVTVYLETDGTVAAIRSPEQVHVKTEMVDHREQQWQLPDCYSLVLESVRALRADYLRECYDPTLTHRTCNWNRVKLWRSKLARLLRRNGKLLLENHLDFENVRLRYERKGRFPFAPTATSLGSICVHTRSWGNKICITSTGEARSVVSTTDPRFTTSAAERIAEFWRKFNRDVYKPMKL